MISPILCPHSDFPNWSEVSAKQATGRVLLLRSTHPALPQTPGTRVVRLGRRSCPGMFQSFPHSCRSESLCLPGGGGSAEPPHSRSVSLCLPVCLTVSRVECCRYRAHGPWEEPEAATPARGQEEGCSQDRPGGGRRTRGCAWQRKSSCCGRQGEGSPRARQWFCGLRCSCGWTR